LDELELEVRVRRRKISIGIELAYEGLQYRPWSDKQAISKVILQGVKVGMIKPTPG